MQVHVTNVVENTEDQLQTSKKDLQVNKANLESQHYDFVSDLRYAAKSINPDQYDNTFTIRNDGKYDAFVRNIIWLTAYCDFDGIPDSVDEKISEEEIKLANKYVKELYSMKFWIYRGKRKER